MLIATGGSATAEQAVILQVYSGNPSVVHLEESQQYGNCFAGTFPAAAHTDCLCRDCLCPRSPFRRQEGPGIKPGMKTNKPPTF